MLKSLRLFKFFKSLEFSFRHAQGLKTLEFSFQHAQGPKTLEFSFQCAQGLKTLEFPFQCAQGPKTCELWFTRQYITYQHILKLNTIIDLPLEDIIIPELIEVDWIKDVLSVDQV